MRAVCDRVTRLKNRDIPAAMRTALHPGQWRPLATEEAEKTLTAIAAPNQRQFIGDFIRSIFVDVFAPNGFFLRMKSPFHAVQTVADYQAARSAVQPSDLGQNLFTKDVAAFEELMAEWVGTEKRKDRRDTGKSDEDIGNWIAYEMLAPDGGHLVSSGPNKDRPVRDVFMPYIVDFLQRKAAASRLDAAVVDAWLRAVLAAWRRMVRALFPNIFRTALRAEVASLGLGGVK